MRVHLLFVCSMASLGVPCAVAQGTPGPEDPECVRKYQTAHAQAVAGRVFEAEAALSAGLRAGLAQEGACAGFILADVAALMNITGRYSEAERYGMRAIGILSRAYAADDPVLLPSLRILTAVRIEQGEFARARESFAQMRAIRLNNPKDRASVHGLAATLARLEGKPAEAEYEYLAALRDRDAAGIAGTADTAATLGALGSLYLDEARYDQARHVLDRAQAIIAAAPDASTWDRIKLLSLHGVLRARLRDWEGAERELGDAITLADGAPSPVDPPALRPILANYAQVLRRNHHSRAARTVERRIAALDPDRTTQIVDVSDLIPRSSRRK